MKECGIDRLVKEGEDTRAEMQYLKLGINVMLMRLRNAKGDVACMPASDMKDKEECNWHRRDIAPSVQLGRRMKIVC